jgi:hypothetical protein
MTVGELREKLNEYDDNLELFFKDEEWHNWNQHAKLRGIEIDNHDNLWFVEGDVVEFNEADFND